MLFNSYEFIFLFLPISFFTYFFLSRKGLILASKVFLVFASLFFYSWWNIAYLPLILSSILFNYVVGYYLNKKTPKGLMHKKTLLTIGIAANVILLGYFKYTDFFIENFNLLFDASFPLRHILLPLAISFFTFQQIAYLVDSYRNETHEYNFLNYALFVTFFPQLIAGPIVHHSEMMPQFSTKDNQVKNYHHIALGIFVFSMGLFKKVVIADTFSNWANLGFENSTTLNFFEAWFTSLSYTFQLYFDFSGYTDMAIGAALLFNIKLPINFFSPYKATNVQDFWRRWHITLSRFLREYIYIPLGGNRVNTYKVYNNILITFVIGGIWHGAGWGFLIWGILHAFAMIIYHIWVKLNIKIHSALAWFLTFNFINISWIFFRAKNTDEALNIITAMIHGTLEFPYGIKNYIEKLFGDSLVSSGAWLEAINGDKSVITWMLIAFSIILIMPNSMEYKNRFKRNLHYLLFTLFLSIAAISNLSKASPFLYFNF